MLSQPSSTASGQESILLMVPGPLVEQIAVRVAELLRDQPQRADTGSVWLDMDGACAYLCLPRDALYKLTAAQAIPCRK